MSKSTCSVFIATSADGFIAKTNGDIDWLHNPDYVIDGLDFGYESFMHSVDALLMGRSTYDQVLTFGEWPYTKPVYVATNRELDIPEALKCKIFRIQGTPEEIIEELRWHEHNRIYVDGGNLIQQFLRDGLIEQMIITRIPILLGNGIPLFGSLDQPLTLKTRSVKSFPNGFVQIEYKLVY